MDRAIGYARGGGPDDPIDAEKILVTTETPFNTFSASKAVTAMVIHSLDEQHLLHLDDPVCESIPEFGKHGKQWITIRHVLTHRAGIPNVPPEAMRVELLDRPEEIVAILCDTAPMWRPGRRLAYHAISGGFILGEIVRRVAGDNIRDALTAEILEPLAFRWMNYGVAPEDVDKVATNYFTGLPVLPPLSWIFKRFLDELIRNQPNDVTRRMVLAKSVEGDLAGAYLPDNEAGEADMSKFPAPVTARWFDPVRGQYTRVADVIQNIGVHRLAPPAKGDWVLLLRR